MEHVEKKIENIPDTENLIQKKSTIKASEDEHKNEGIKSKSFMETSDSILGSSKEDMIIAEPQLSFDVWFPKGGVVTLDAFQSNLLGLLASDNAISNGTATIIGIKGGAILSGLPGSDLGGILEVANFRAIAVNTALNNLVPGYIPTDQTVTDYKGDIIGNSEVDNKYINGNEARVSILFNNAKKRDVSRIKDIALQIDSHTR